MEHMTWLALTGDMTPQKRSKLFNKLSKRKQNKLMDSTFEYLEQELNL